MLEEINFDWKNFKEELKWRHRQWLMFVFYSEICFLVSEVPTCRELNLDQKVKYHIGILNELARILSVTVRWTLKEVDSAFLTAASLPSPTHITKIHKEREHGTQSQEHKGQIQSWSTLLPIMAPSLPLSPDPSSERNLPGTQGPPDLNHNSNPFHSQISSSLNPRLLPPSPSPILVSILDFISDMLPLNASVCLFWWKRTSCHKRCCLTLRLWVAKEL